MSIRPDLLIGLYRGLLHENPQHRSEHADSVTDLHRSMDDAELHGIESLLAVLAVWESDANAREAQLHALAELHEWHETTVDVVELVRRIDRTTLTGSEIEYVAYLMSEED
jgi:hypothetical protein